MRKSISCLSLVIMMIIMTMTSCSDTPEYAGMIPDDAMLVMRLDVKKIVEKSGTENGQFKDKMLEMLDGEEISAGLRSKLKAIIDDPAESGIDLRDPIIVYMTNNGGKTGGGMLGSIRDADKLAELLQMISKEQGESELKTKDNLKYVYDKNFILAFNDDVLFLNPDCGNDESEAVKTAGDILAGKATDGNGFVKKLLASDGEMQVLVTGKAYETIPAYRTIIQQLPEGADLKDVACLFDLTTEKGKAEIAYGILTASDAWKEVLKKYEEAYNPINGDLLEYISKDGLAIVMNCNGEKLMTNIEAQGIEKTIGKSGMLQARNIVTTLDGNIAIDIRSFDMSSGMPDVSFYAKSKNSVIADMAGGLLGEMAKTGYKDGTCYCLTGERNEPFKAPADVLDNSDAKGKLFYMRFNFDMLQKAARNTRGTSSMAMFATSQILETAEMTYESGGKGKITVTLRDKDKNPLETLSELLLAQFG